VVGASLALFVVAHLTPPTLFEGQDWLLLHLPGKMYAADSLARGRLPLWNPYVGLGRPFLADIEMAVLYPPNLLYVLLDPGTTLFVLSVAHYGLALAGLLGLGHAFGLSRWVSWLIAGCFLWGAPLIARLSAGQVPYVQASCYIPLLLLLGLRLQDGWTNARLAGFATALGLQLLCGHPQIAWVTWVGLGAFLLGRALPPGDRPLRKAAAGLGGLAVALVAAFGLGAATMLPFLELVRQGNRAEPSLAFASGGTMEWWHWTSLVVPDGGRRAFYWEFNLYAGLLPVVLGLGGLLRLRDPNARGLSLMAVVGGLIAAGPRTPAFALLYHVVPGLAGFHIHSRAALLVLVALLLGAGLYLSRPSSYPPAVRFAALGSALVLAGALAFRAAAPATATPRLLLERLVMAVTVAALAGLAVAGPPGWIRTRLAPAALSVVVLVDLASSVSHQARGGICSRRRAGGSCSRHWCEPACTAAFCRHAWPFPSVSPAQCRTALQLVRPPATTPDPERVWGLRPPVARSQPRWTEHLRLASHLRPRPFPYESMNLAAGWDARQGRLVVRPPPGDPRIYLVHSVRRVNGWEEAVALMASGHDFHGEALVETAMSLPGPDARSKGPGTVSVTAFGPEQIVLAASTDTPALLVFAEAWYPGWSATVDGREAPCIPANGWMRAVLLPAGRHDVRLSFRSRWLATGVLISIATVVVLLGAVARARQRAD
jgi:hypothetical protein